MQRNQFSSLLVMAATACGLLASAAPCRAQDQSQTQSQTDSVAEAARKAREKRKASTKSPKVISDDDLDKSNFQPGQEGINVGSAPKLETEPPSPEAVAAEEAEDQAAAEKAADEDAELAKLKLRLADAEKDLDLAQRELALDQDAYLSKTDYANDTAGKAKLDSERQQIGDKQQEIEKLKTRIAALEELKSQRKTSKRKAARSKPTEKSENPTTDNATPPPAAPPQS